MTHSLHTLCRRALAALVPILMVLLLARTAAANAYQARHALTPAEYQTTFDTLAREGYRLKNVSGYDNAGQELYAALWEKSSGPEWTARHGLSAADYQKAFDDLGKAGFRLTFINGHEHAGAVKYSAIWEKRAGAPWVARHGLTGAQYQQTFDELTKQGFRLLHVSGYSNAGQANYAAIFEKSSGPVWTARHAMTAAQYQTAFNENGAHGYRLKEVSGYHVGGQDEYAAIWEQTGGPMQAARHGIPVAYYQNTFDNFDYQAYQPVFTNAFSSGGSAKVNGIWENTTWSAADLQAISSQMSAHMQKFDIPGLSLAITKDGRLVYAAGFGTANKATGEEAGPRSEYRIASVSKNITTAAIMHLIEQGTLHLDDKVFGPTGHLGAQFPTPASNRKIEKITIKHLLEHVSGLSNMGGDPMFMNTNMSHSQLIGWYLNDAGHRMAIDPGQRYEYLNFGYCLLGRIIEKVSHKTYEQYVKDAVLGPAGVTGMAIAGNTPAEKKPREVSYYPSDAYGNNVARFDSHGGWVASPIDLVRYAVRVDGLATKPDIMSTMSHTTMLTAPHVLTIDGRDPNYGFGWGLPQWHNGDIIGTVAFLEVIDGGYTYAVLANTRPSGDTGGFEMSKAVKKAIASVGKWPSFDRF
jgi:CubicO group peptidase (beta-lactamase class C family)